MRANEQADKRMAQYFYPDYRLIQATVHSLQNTISGPRGVRKDFYMGQKLYVSDISMSKLHRKTISMNNDGHSGERRREKGMKTKVRYDDTRDTLPSHSLVVE